MDLQFDSRPANTISRVAELDQYMSTHVLSDNGFVCPHAGECQTSHHGEFFAGQLHHVGEHYDLQLAGRPFRIAVIGQEYGNEPDGVDRIGRTRAVVMDTGIGRRFRTDGCHPARNPHMRGTTSVLRLLFGVGLGSDYEGEFLTLEAQRVHIFEAFALTNYLLCSAIAAGQGTTGSKRGRSTPVMQRNCSAHFLAAIEILDPTVLIIQGRGVRKWLNRVAVSVEPLTEHLEHMAIGSCRALVASFTHPSVPSGDNWGINERRPYLRKVVEPTVQAIHRAIFESPRA